MRLAVSIAWIVTACGSAPRERPAHARAENAEPVRVAPFVAAPVEAEADFDVDPASEAWGPRAEQEIRVTVARSSDTSAEIECLGTRCKVAFPSEAAGHFAEWLHLPDCAVERLGNPLPTFVVDCWEPSASAARATLEARVREFSEGTALQARVRALSCAEGRCRVELVYPNRAAASMGPESLSSGRILGRLEDLCAGEVSGIQPAPDTGGVVRTIDLDCRAGHRRDWSVGRSEWEDRADEEQMFARLREEPRDAPWADATERALREQIPQRVAVHLVECRTTKCLVQVDTVDEGDSAFRALRQVGSCRAHGSSLRGSNQFLHFTCAR